MAKYKDGPFGDINGKFGKTVISRYKKKKYVRTQGDIKTRSTKPKKRTLNLQTYLNEAWNCLSREEKLSWTRLLKSNHIFKNSKGKEIQTAKGLFSSLNRNLQEADEPTISFAPALPGIIQNEISMEMEILIKGKRLDISLYIHPGIEEWTKYILYATPVLTTAAEFPDKRLFRRIKAIGFEFKSGSSIKKDYLKVFKKMPELGEEISLQYKGVSRECGNTIPPKTILSTAKKV